MDCVYYVVIGRLQYMGNVDTCSIANCVPLRSVKELKFVDVRKENVNVRPF